MTDKGNAVDEGKAERDVKVRAAYSAAVKRLREEYRVEFARFLRDEYRKAGIKVKPRLTPEQRAERAKARAEARAEAEEARRLAKIAALQEQIAALGG